MTISDKKIRAYALKNAIAHEGVAMAGAVISSLFAEGLKKSEMKKYGKKINEIILEINSLNLGQQEEEYEKLKNEVHEREVREGLPELPDAEKGVVMRIAPSASGPMHLPHALNLSLNYLYVKKYGGDLYVRIEDTNPETSFPDAYGMINKEAEWLTKGKAKVGVQSDRMELYYSYAEKLIDKRAAYVCICSAEDFKNFVKEKKECPCRKNSVSRNKELWKKMLDKNGFSEGDAVLRFKTLNALGGMKHKNPAMRDFPLARICESSHPLKKKKYRVWPLMNLAVSIDDILMKMTHIIRGKDHRDNAERQKMIYKILGKKYPWNAFMGKLHFKGAEFSTRMFRKAIEDGKYSGWDDPKLDTLASLIKCGYKPEAFWKLAKHIGLTEVDKVMERKDFFEVFDRFNE